MDILSSKPRSPECAEADPDAVRTQAEGSGIGEKPSGFRLGAVEGFATHLGSLLVIRAGWSTALPIPLSIEAPECAGLAAWALRLSEAGANPACVLVVSGQPAPGVPRDWIVRTHFGPVRIGVRAASRERVMPSEDTPSVLLALLRAAVPDLLEAVSKALAALPDALNSLRAREPGVPGRRMSGDRLRIEQPLDFLPACAVIRAGSSPHLVPVRTIDIIFDDREFTEIGLDATGVSGIDDVLFLLGDRRLIAIREADRNG